MINQRGNKENAKKVVGTNRKSALRKKFGSYKENGTTVLMLKNYQNFVSIEWIFFESTPLVSLFIFIPSFFNHGVQQNFIW